MMDNIDPGQPFLRVNIIRWREIFRMIETPSSNVDLIGVCRAHRSETFHSDYKTSSALPSPSDIRVAFLSRIGTANVLL